MFSLSVRSASVAVIAADADRTTDTPAYFRLPERQQLALAGGCFFTNRMDMYGLDGVQRLAHID